MRLDFLCTLQPKKRQAEGELYPTREWLRKVWKDQRSEL